MRGGGGEWGWKCGLRCADTDSATACFFSLMWIQALDSCRPDSNVSKRGVAAAWGFSAIDLIVRAQSKYCFPVHLFSQWWCPQDQGLLLSNMRNLFVTWWCQCDHCFGLFTEVGIPFVTVCVHKIYVPSACTDELHWKTGRASSHQTLQWMTTSSYNALMFGRKSLTLALPTPHPFFSFGT